MTDVVERVRQLIQIMADNGLVEMEVEEPDLRIRLTKEHPQPAPTAVPFGFNFGQIAPPSGHLPASAPPAPIAAEAPSAAQPNLVEVTSPMVGTFYRSPSPGAEPYVSVGVEVDADTVVCIIEAMKVMNEIKAEVSGRVVEILVEDAEPIEYGQVLFLLEPAEA
jgi:acetyl-CoA carboxylase biotin carboxyl carrier protein